MTLSESYAVNAPHAIEECFEAEVIAVNLEVGTYFSLRETAADAWVRLVAGQRPHEILSAWTGQFGALDTMSLELEKFVADLVDEGLLRAEDRAPGGTAKRIAVSAYVAPTLEKYTDMQDLLLLDPVHDVDDTGWPAVRPA